MILSKKWLSATFFDALIWYNEINNKTKKEGYLWKKL